MRVLITGVAGQDGTILATQLARQGHEILGLVKPGTESSILRRYVPSIDIVECDLADHDLLMSTIRDYQPNETYNLGGFTSPGASWDNEAEVLSINVESVRAIVDVMSGIPDARLFQASSASIFEGVDVIPQTERTERTPQSPYAKSKVLAMDVIDAARAGGLFAASGILYNHESPLRGEQFVTRRATPVADRAKLEARLTTQLDTLEAA